MQKHIPETAPSHGALERPPARRMRGGSRKAGTDERKYSPGPAGRKERAMKKYEYCPYRVERADLEAARQEGQKHLCFPVHRSGRIRFPNRATVVYAVAPEVRRENYGKVLYFTSFVPGAGMTGGMLDTVKRTAVFDRKGGDDAGWTHRADHEAVLVDLLLVFAYQIEILEDAEPMERHQHPGELVAARQEASLRKKKSVQEKNLITFPGMPEKEHHQFLGIRSWTARTKAWTRRAYIRTLKDGRKIWIPPVTCKRKIPLGTRLVREYK